MRKPQEQARLVAASAPLKIGKREYTMSRLTDRDISELDEWVQARFVENARNSLKDEADENIRQETLAIAMREALAITWVSGVGAKMIATPLGMARLVWQCIRKAHPDISLSDLTEDMFDPQNIENARQTFEKLNLGKEEGPPPQKKRRKNRRRKR